LIRFGQQTISVAFDEIFRSAGFCARQYAAPKANVVAEHFVRTVRSECLDWLLILSTTTHSAHTAHSACAHQTLTPTRATNISRDTASRQTRGLIYEYYRAAA